MLSVASPLKVRWESMKALCLVSEIYQVKRLNEKAEIGRKYRWNHSSYRSGIHFVCAIYNGCNVVLSIEISYDKMMKNL